MSSPGDRRPDQLERYRRRVGREWADHSLKMVEKHHGLDGVREFLDEEEPPLFLEGALEGGEP